MGDSYKETQSVQVPRCLYVYWLNAIFVKSVDKWKRLREEIVTLSDCSLLVKGYIDTEFGLLY